MKFHDNRWDNRVSFGLETILNHHELDRDILTLKLIRHILDLLDVCV